MDSQLERPDRAESEADVSVAAAHVGHTLSQELHAALSPGGVQIHPGTGSGRKKKVGQTIRIWCFPDVRKVKNEPL